MTTIRASCNHCNHDVEFNHDKLVLIDHSYVDDPGQIVTTYQFDCPLCGEFNIRGADEHVATVLIGGGVEYKVIEVGTESVDVTDPIDDGEVADFIIDLQEEITADDLTTL